MPKILTTEYSDSEKDTIREKPYLDPSFAAFMKAADDIMARMGIKNRIEVSDQLVDLVMGR